ncbi:hypothetical protein K505DRAFT_228573 [Melanomma pulvis-pyrius CBS 109.77]|uniref:Uncharacterized protein n=1 Tax=Melanomma pulvis-pyrius CBS 109.77 TaxID=1314802 RepID=A0A6A6XY22_9PLEO|nr:hypothetical protein K505DRAFT_228573 [Melanomma pulvis-pyrius CBS 109.77]
MAIIRSAVSSSKSPDASTFITLLDSGTLATARTQKPAFLRLFGPSSDDFPQIGRITSPFATKGIPSAKELRDMLLKELAQGKADGDETPVYMPHPPIHEEGRGGLRRKTVKKEGLKEAALNLITNIPNPTYTAPGMIPSLPSPTLEALCSDSKENPPDLLSATEISCAILPCNTYQPLQHYSEGTTLTTLLTGTQVSIIWPPTSTNLSKLAAAYKAFARTSDPSLLAITSTLEGGIALVQRRGDTLRVPPFCPTIALATSTTVLAMYHIVPASSFLPICLKIPFLQHWWPTETRGDEKRAAFGEALLDCMARIMDCEFESYAVTDVAHGLDTPGPLLELVRNWDVVKGDVLAVMGEAERAEVARKWIALLSQSSGMHCLICKKWMRTKEKDIPKHFMSSHWV